MTDLQYGGDLVTASLAKLGLEYVAVNPGASFRGLHESLVNAGSPEMVLALHENIAVAVAHGYAKSSERPMGVVLHNLVGLQSGSMGIFNAWADQVPMVIIGGSGPADAAVRRPWIDWVHSARQQALVVRDHLKWDDQPTSLAGIPPSIARAHRIATTVPMGPTYVSVDILLQEEEVPPGLAAQVEAPAEQFRGRSLTAPPQELEEICDLLVSAERPVILADYVGKSRVAYQALIELAELLAIPVVDLQARHNFPTGHWADGTPGHAELLGASDLVLALDLRDLMYGIGETNHVTHSYTPMVKSGTKVVSISTNQLMLRGFIDYCGPIGDALEVLADTAVCLPSLVQMVKERELDRRARQTELVAYTTELHVRTAPPMERSEAGVVSIRELSSATFESVRSGPWEIANGHLRGNVRSIWEMTRFNSSLGRNIGAGLGYGIGVSIGAALAHRGDDTVVVNLQNDGDLLYTPQGLWTAARYGLPILNVVVNNRTYGQDRMHQQLVSQSRSRPLDHASVGIDIDDPAINFKTMAESQGVEAWGPVSDTEELQTVLERAVKVVREERRPALVDVLVPR